MGGGDGGGGDGGGGDGGGDGGGGDGGGDGGGGGGDGGGGGCCSYFYGRVFFSWFSLLTRAVAGVAEDDDHIVLYCTVFLELLWRQA